MGAPDYGDIQGWTSRVSSPQEVYTTPHSRSLDSNIIKSVLLGAPHTPYVESDTILVAAQEILEVVAEFE